jgi:hypothetical protein
MGLQFIPKYWIGLHFLNNEGLKVFASTPSSLVAWPVFNALKLTSWISVFATF